MLQWQIKRGSNKYLSHFTHNYFAWRFLHPSPGKKQPRIAPYLNMKSSSYKTVEVLELTHNALHLNWVILNRTLYIYIFIIA